ncbi:hypothetical protein ZPAH1_orf00112 [Aeromonas phage ZPAH1]|nr:hypothetical protein ZPAH1_orf00112 [Aeromonas phage ZPAH1]
MIEVGKKYKITTPVLNTHIVGVGDVIEVFSVSWIGVKAFKISVDEYGDPYDGILMFNGPYSKTEYWKLIEDCLEEVE